MRRHWPLAWSGWRDLDEDHARPDENPIQRPWKRVNSNRTVWLEGNVLKIMDYSETVLEMGGVSYEKQPFTENWGCDFELNCDGNVLQQQFWGAAITPSWAHVGFTSVENRPMVVVWRDPLSAANSIRIIVYSGGVVNTLASTINYTGLMARTWWRFRILVDRDRLVRVYYFNNMLLQYWLPAQYKTGLGNRSLSFLNQTSAWSEQRNFRVFDHQSIFRTATQWSVEAKSDDFNRANGAVANGWTEYGAAGQVASNSYAATGTADGSYGIITDMGVLHGVQRVEATVGGANGPNTTSDSSLILRCNADGTEGLMANFYSSAIFICKFTGSIASRVVSDATTTPITLSAGDKVAFSITGNGAWVEVNGVVVLMADIEDHYVAPTNSWAGLRVERQSGVNSNSWNDVRVLTVPWV